jgi:NAD(P)-dependent dehydrogenase (short-subunit alcohol dehydrogenase family)
MHAEEPGRGHTPRTTLSAGDRLLVVGGSSGFGLGVAREGIRLGAAVTIVGRTPGRLDAAARHLRGFAAAADAGGRLAAALVADAHEDDGADRILDTVNGVDHLVSLVGTPMGGGFLSAPLAEIRGAVESKFFANLRLARAASLRIRSGSMTFTGGTGGRPQGAAGSWVGNLGVDALVQGVAVEAAPRVRVNAVAPTWTPTTLWRDRPAEEVEETRRSFAARIPLGRTAREEEVVAAYLFCLRNGFVTGQTIAVDGGVMLP